MFFFFFSSRRRHTRYWRDWSSDVCSSDLSAPARRARVGRWRVPSRRPAAHVARGRGQRSDRSSVSSAWGHRSRAPLWLRPPDNEFRPRKFAMTATISPAGRRDIAHHLHPYTQLRQLERDGPLVIVRGDGVHVIAEDGKRYIEGMAGLWCASLGFSETRLADAATRQM